MNVPGRQLLRLDHIRVVLLNDGRPGLHVPNRPVRNPEGDGVASGAQLKLTVDPLAEEGFVPDGPQAALESESDR